MKFIRLITLMLCISFLLLSLTGCNDTDTDNGAEEDIGTSDEAMPEDEVNLHIHGPDCGHALQMDFDAAIETFAPDTVMIRSNDLEITWAELYIFIFSSVTNILQAYGMEINWDDAAPDGSSVADLFLEHATEEAILFLTYKYGMEDLGFSLSDDELKEFNDTLDEIIAMEGGKEVLEESLRGHGGFYNFEVFESLFKLEYSIGFLVEQLYGEDFSDFPDERIEEYAEEEGYMMALHILRLKAEDEDDETPLEEIEEILTQLKARVGSADFAEYFKELMEEHSEDHGGLISFPDGYLFQHGDMVEPFSNAAAELEEGALSDVVETVFGYHIIYKLSLDFDAVPIAFANDPIPRTLRQLAALDDFEDIRQQWRDALNIEFTPEYNSIDLAVIFHASYAE